ncbi:MAG: response regulator [Lachnospiraceae bacterium]|nr:response regulator [Lachnospiraceae bacterium]MBQ8317097.1 response regulator [Lachnospiraceae bacterium]
MNKQIKNIAIVDDDEISRIMMYKYLLLEKQYSTNLYASGEEFLESTTRKIPDLVILDIEMPGANGIEVFDRMRKIKELEHVPVIFITGKEDKNTVLRCIGRGADGYMVKPVTKDVLKSKMEEVIKRYSEFKSNKTILMVDDDVEFLKISKIKLSKYYKVLTVDSGKTALDYLSSHTVDLIILDYFMPLYDGKNILNILKHRDSTKKIPVIMVTALSSDEVINACGDNQPDAIVTKPVDIEELLSKINMLVCTD